MTANNAMISLSKLVSNSGVTYSAQANAFLTQAYVSAANNAYFNAIRFAEGIIIKEDVGQGHTHTFLNGLRIYHAASHTLLADRSYHCCFYSTHIVKEESRQLLVEALEKAVKSTGASFNRAEAQQLINKVITEAFEKDQLKAAEQHSRQLLQNNQ